MGKLWASAVAVGEEGYTNLMAQGASEAAAAAAAAVVEASRTTKERKQRLRMLWAVNMKRLEHSSIQHTQTHTHTPGATARTSDDAEKGGG